MTLIDQYIFDHKHEFDASELANKIGITEDNVKSRILRLERIKDAPTVPITIQDEMYALVNYINTKQSGCTVDIAIQRVKDLNKIINR